jgi:DNA-binding response OmpR family regulator
MDSASEADFQGKVVLVAEDEPLIRNYVRRVLSRMGFHVVDAADGAEAHELSRRHRGEIHLLLTNVKMPRMNGVELAKQLQTERPDLKVLVMSGHTSGMLEELAARTNFLEKPFLPETLKSKIRAVLRGSSTEPEHV